MKLARLNNILLAVVITVTFVASVSLASSVLAAGTAVVSVSAHTQTVTSGTQFTVNITVQPNNAIAGVQFNLSFNPALVIINSVSEGNLLKQGSASTYFMPGTINNTTGTVTGVAGAIITPGQTVSTPGTFAVIIFTAGTTSGTSTLTLSNVIIGDINGQSVIENVVNGQVVISGVTTTTTTPPTTTTTTTTPPTTTTTTPPYTGGGGGSGAGPIGPASVAGVTDVTNAVNTQGAFNQDVNAWSADNKVLMRIPTGTTGLTSNGTSLTQIGMMHMTTPPPIPAGAGIVSLAYDFIPSGMTFSPLAIIRFSYDPSLIPAGVAETSLQIAYYDSTATSWIMLTSSVDTANHFISAQIAHFTPYAVTYGVKAMTPAPTTTTPVVTTSSTPLTNTSTTMAVTTTAALTPPTTITTVSTTPAPTTATAMATIQESPTISNNPPSANETVVRMSMLASVIGIAVFLITATATFLWLRHRELLKKGGCITGTKT